MPRGVGCTTWDLRLTMLARDGFRPSQPQKVAVIVTWRDPEKRGKVYNQTIDIMRRIGWVTQNLQVKDRIRIRT